MSRGSLDVRPITRRIGAEIFGVDLAKPLSAALRDDIHSALMEHQVVFFRDQHLDPARLKAFGRQFGDLAIHTAVDGPRDHPEIMVVQNDAKSKWVPGERWHADLTCNPEPPMGSILYLQTVPAVGGDTLFANMYAAYDALSEPMKAYVAGLTAVHDGNPLFRSVFPDVDRQYPVSTHPVVRTHPVTGRKALYVNPEYTMRIVEVSRVESDGILQTLFHHFCANPNFHMRFRWSPNTVAFWDNYCTQHLAVWDYYPDTRAGLRIQLAGDKPY
jgi:taurine dioxygenase